MVDSSPPPFDNFGGHACRRLSRPVRIQRAGRRPRTYIPQHLAPEKVAQGALARADVERRKMRSQNRYRNHRRRTRRRHGLPAGGGDDDGDLRRQPPRPAARLLHARPVGAGGHRHVFHGADQLLHRAQGARRRLAATPLPPVLWFNTVDFAWQQRHDSCSRAPARRRDAAFRRWWALTTGLGPCFSWPGNRGLAAARRRRECFSPPIRAAAFFIS